MSATKVLVFYNTLALVSSPNTCLRRIVILDKDSDSQYHSAASGETKFEILVAAYETLFSEGDIVNYILSQVQINP